MSFTGEKSDTKSAHDDRDSLERTHTADDDTEKGLFGRVRSACKMFQLDDIQTAGVSQFLNPTYIGMRVRFRESRSSSTHKELVWRARDNRKGRNSIAVPMLFPDGKTNASIIPSQFTPKLTTTFTGIMRILWGMVATFPYWNMAFWSGWSYTIGSVLFVAVGVLAWGPLAYGEHFASHAAEKYGSPMCFFIGALFYQVGAVVAYLEAVNDGSFHGAAMRRLLEGHQDNGKLLLDQKMHQVFSHVNPVSRHSRETQRPVGDPGLRMNTVYEGRPRQGSIYPLGKRPPVRRGAVDHGGVEGQESIYLTWQWWPTWKALRDHHVHDIGYLACAIQLFGVTLYGVTAIVYMPGLLSTLTWHQKLAAFWIPQVVAASCFLVSSLMFMLETQCKWYKPEPGVLGWWVGLWATVGSVGFELIAIFGIQSHSYSWGKYQSDLATIWGSAAYFICSFLQWYEALDKSPWEDIIDGPVKKSIDP